MSTEQREPFDWPRACLVLAVALALAGGLAVRDAARRIRRKASR